MVKWGISLLVVAVAVAGIGTLVHLRGDINVTDFLAICGIGILCGMVGGILMVAGWGKRRDE